MKRLLLNLDKIEKESKAKAEPPWLMKKRLEAAERFNEAELDNKFFALGIHKARLQEKEKKAVTPEKLPKDVEETLKALNIGEEEWKVLAGLNTQVDNTSIYNQLKAVIEEKGVIFTSMEEAVRKHEHLIRPYLYRLTFAETPYAALNSALWKGGIFVYIPKDLKLPYTLQAFFVISSAYTSQTERTLIIVDEDAAATYIEGCAAPVYRNFAFHLPASEVFINKGAELTYITLQNWSKNIRNVVTGKALVKDNATIHWMDANVGSEITKKAPLTILKGDGAKMTSYSLAFASKEQRISLGTRVVVKGKEASAHIKSKSILDGGVANFDTDITVEKNAALSTVFSECDTHILSDGSSESTPNIENLCSSARVSHEASVGRFDEEKVAYLRMRGFEEERAKELMVIGSVQDFLKKIPFEYAVEFRKMLELKVKGIG